MSWVGRRPHLLLSLALLAAALPLRNAHAGLVSSASLAGSPPEHALVAVGDRSAGGAHGFGAMPPAPSSGRHVSAAVVSLDSLPASVDLSQWAPPVGNQGSVNSCLAWADDYYLRGWYARRDGYYPGTDTQGTGSFAPMYTYSQLVNGQNAGTYMNDHFHIMQTQGIDPRASYAQGDYNYTSLPNSTESAQAATYKIQSYSNPFSTGTLPGGTAVQQAIETALANNTPVVLLLQVWGQFYNANASNYVVSYPGTGTMYGNHGVIALKYDAGGVWIENQWGTGWGLNGWAKLSWDYVNHYVYQVGEIVPSTPSSTRPTSTPAPVTNTPMPTSVPRTPAPTATPIPKTATPVSVAPTAVPTNISVSAPKNLMQNGGFDSGLANWQTSSSKASLKTVTGGAHSGWYSLMMCNVNNCTDRAWQTITVPTTFSSAQLSFWYWITSTETATTCNDSLSAQIRTTAGIVIGTVRTLCNTNRTTGWVQATSDVTSLLQPYAGQQVQVAFQGSTNTLSPSGFYLDDVSLTVR